MKRERRRINLIKKDLQLKVVFYMFLTTVVILTIHSWILLWLYHRVLPSATHTMAPRTFLGILFLDLLLTVILLLLLDFAVGILFSHRFAGPIYKFEKMLGRIAQGDLRQDITLRKGDMLQAFGAEFNRALEGLRQVAYGDREIAIRVREKLEILLARSPENEVDRKVLEEAIEDLDTVGRGFVLAADGDGKVAEPTKAAEPGKGHLDEGSAPSVD